MPYPFLQVFVAPILAPIYLLWVKEIKGLENIPKDKPFIIALNHSSYFDTLLMYFILPPRIYKKIHALVNKEYWKIPIVRQVLDQFESIPVHVSRDPGSKQRNKESMAKALEFARKGDLLMIFPEGGRSIDGNLKKARTGVARLALSSGLSVLPVGLIGTHNVLPKGAMFPRFKRCRISIGKPLYFKNNYGKKFNKKILEEVTRLIMKRIAREVGQEYGY